MWSGGAFGLVAGWSIEVQYNTWKEKKFVEFLYDIASNLYSIPKKERNDYLRYLFDALLKWRGKIGDASYNAPKKINIKIILGLGEMIIHQHQQSGIYLI